MTKKLPAILFYTGDWLKDPAVSQCSPATRGIWMDLLCAMHEAGREGEISGTLEALSRVCRCTAGEMESALNELKDTDAATITLASRNPQRDKKVTVVNRRMKRDEITRKQGRKRNSEYRDRHRDAEVTPPSSSSSSTSVKEEVIRDDFSYVVDHWNSSGLTTIRKLTNSRKRTLKKRMEDSYFRDNWREAVDRVKESAFCTGENDRGWKAGIDWFLRPDTVVKLMEGGYGNNGKKPTSRVATVEDLANYDPNPQGGGS